MVARVTSFVAKKRRLSGPLSERLRLLLTERGKDVTWLAAQTGLHRVSVSRIVNGHVTDPAVSVVVKLAAALGVTVLDLVDNGGDGKPAE